jgi:hypothetical protein
MSKSIKQLSEMHFPKHLTPVYHDKYVIDAFIKSYNIEKQECFTPVL